MCDSASLCSWGFAGLETLIVKARVSTPETQQFKLLTETNSSAVLGPPVDEQVDLKGGRKGTSVDNYSVVEVTILNYQKAIVTATQCGKMKEYKQNSGEFLPVPLL